MNLGPEPEHTHADGTIRKDHYSTGKQPWDSIVEHGWAPGFAAGNVLKYLRCNKQQEDSKEKARWYFARLTEMAHDKSDTARMNDAFRIRMQLLGELIHEEWMVLSL